MEKYFTVLKYIKKLCADKCNAGLTKDFSAN